MSTPDATPASPDEIGITLLVSPEKTAADFQRLARGLGLHCHQKLDRPESGPTEHWITKDASLVVSWMPERWVDGTFLWIRGNNWEACADRLRSSLACLDLDELCTRLLNGPMDHDTWVACLFWIAYMARGNSGGVRPIEVFDRALADSRPTLRLAAIGAWRMRDWPAWRDRVEKAAADDPDPEVRAEAAKVLR